MKKTLLVLSFFAFSCLVANAQDGLAVSRQSETGLTKKGRFEIQAGMAVLTAPVEDGSGMEDLSRVGFHIGIFGGGFLKTPNHTLGAALDYRYNTYSFSIPYNEYGNRYGRSSKDYKTHMHTIFIGPQYSWMSNPYGKGSFIGDYSIGYVHYLEKVKDVDVDFNASAFGAKISAGYAIAIKKPGQYFTIKASFFGSKWRKYSAESNISSFNLSASYIL